MLNYNLNIIEPLKQDKKGRLSKPVIVWGFEEKTQTPLGDLDVVLANASMSIIASASNCLGVSEDETNFFFSSPEAEVSASLQGAGRWPTTGSVTMSLLSAGTKPNSETLFYTASYIATAASGNLNQSGSIIRNNFNSPIGYDWVITGSIITRKGNESNSKINWIESGSTDSDDNSIFNIVKNANEVLVPNIFMTASQSGSFFNDYAFNITASISGAKDWEYSSSFQALTMSISIPEIGYYVTSSHTASIITGSFAADVYINPYNITASLELEPYPSYSLDEFVFIGKGGDGGSGQTLWSGGGGGAGAVISGSQMWVYANSIYWVNIGGGSGSIDTATTFYSGSNYYVKALNGGDGATNYNNSGSNGGSGGGSTGGNPNDFYNSWPGGKSLPSIWTGSINLTITGSRGGNGRNYSPNVPIPTFFGLSGGGGGAASAGEDASTDRSQIAAGGAGIDNILITSITGQTGSFAEGGEGNIGPIGSVPGVPNPNGTPNGLNALNYGQGGGGAQGTNDGITPGGTGYQGIAIFKYLGPQRGRGGVYSFDGTYSYHTFTSSSYYWSTAAMQPKKH
jgi:hypothetical protein